MERPRLPLLALREITMLQLMNAITDKKDWHIKAVSKNYDSRTRVRIMPAPVLFNPQGL